MALELSNSSPATRTTLTGLFARWEARIAATLALAQERGDLARDRDVHELAAAVLEAWEGAAMRGKVQRDRMPYERFARITLTRSPRRWSATRRPVGRISEVIATNLKGTPR